MGFSAFRENERQEWSARARDRHRATAQASRHAVPQHQHMVRPHPGARLLDLCCRPRNLAGAAAALGAKTAGIDFAEAVSSEDGSFDFVPAQGTETRESIRTATTDRVDPFRTADGNEIPRPCFLISG